MLVTWHLMGCLAERPQVKLQGRLIIEMNHTIASNTPQLLCPTYLVKPQECCLVCVNGVVVVLHLARATQSELYIKLYPHQRFFASSSVLHIACIRT